MNILKLTLFTLLLSFFAFNNVKAQSYDTIVNKNVEIEKGNEKKTILSLDKEFGIIEMGISVMKPENVLKDQFVIRISPLNRVTYKFETEFKDVFLDVKILEMALDTSELPKNPQFECGQYVEEANIDIVVSKFDLKAHGTKYMRISSGPFMDFFEIRNAKHFVELIHADEMGPAQYYIAQKRNNIRDTLKVWFYPENTYILYVPEFEKVKENIKEKVERLAKRKGFIPLVSKIPDFENPLYSENTYYFVDDKGDYTKELGEHTGGFLDNIYTEMMVYKLEGDVSTLKPVPVYARKPVLYE
jgi:hypothetical protein